MRLMVVVLLFALSFAYSNGFTVEVGTGTSFKSPNTLTIEQAGYENVSFPGSTYETRPWSVPSNILDLTENYYYVRLGYALENVSLEVEWLHDKAYYVGKNDVIQHFELSDGLNSLLFNLVFTEPIVDNLDLAFRVGGGLAIPNPATIIRGKRSGTREHLSEESRYYVSGVTFNSGVQTRYRLNDWLAVTGEIRYVYSYINVPIVDGHASGHFHGIHFNFGVLLF